MSKHILITAAFASLALSLSACDNGKSEAFKVAAQHEMEDWNRRGYGCWQFASSFTPITMEEPIRISGGDTDPVLQALVSAELLDQGIDSASGDSLFVLNDKGREAKVYDQKAQRFCHTRYELVSIGKITEAPTQGSFNAEVTFREVPIGDWAKNLTKGEVKTPGYFVPAGPEWRAEIRRPNKS